MADLLKRKTEDELGDLRRKLDQIERALEGARDEIDDFVPFTEADREVLENVRDFAVDAAWRIRNGYGDDPVALFEEIADMVRGALKLKD